MGNIEFTDNEHFYIPRIIHEECECFMIDGQLAGVATCKPFLSDNGENSGWYCEIVVGNSKLDKKGVLNFEIIDAIKRHIKEVKAEADLPLYFSSHKCLYDLAAAKYKRGEFAFNFEKEYKPRFMFHYYVNSYGDVVTLVRDYQKKLSVQYNGAEQSYTFNILKNCRLKPDDLIKEKEALMDIIKLYMESRSDMISPNTAEKI